MTAKTPKKPSSNAALSLKPIQKADWPAVELLFGPNGAAGGCWCQWWRVEKGGKSWEACKGAPNRLALEAQIEAGAVHAIMARRGRNPVGWCCIGPRPDFPRLRKSRMAREHEAENAWVVSCLFVTRAERGQGTGLELVKAATALAFERGAKLVQAYPAPVKEGARSVDVFAWTGVPAMFPKKDGWRRIDDGEGRPVLALKPNPSSRAKSPSRG
ncbi:MAG: GCN5-related N-acetyltransferase [Alphaproteobacteria bacterium]|jgi:GNAT superfamily N-acetyltransferase|nr:GCN5-related N-acetyltransferase [Alphaproteobacteria bacterium]